MKIESIENIKYTSYRLLFLKVNKPFHCLCIRLLVGLRILVTGVCLVLIKISKFVPLCASFVRKTVQNYSFFCGELVTEIKLKWFDFIVFKTFRKYASTNIDNSFLYFHIYFVRFWSRTVSVTKF